MEQAFRRVPRHLFVERFFVGDEEGWTPVEHDPARPQPEHLDTIYSGAALMAELVGDQALVVTIDIQQDVVEDARRNLTRAGYPGIRVLCQDGFAGAPEAALFDRVVATAGCPDISPRWVEQLARSASMLVPLRHAGANPLVRVMREGGEIVGKVVGLSGFMGIQGQLRDEHYVDLSQPRRNGAEEERTIWPELATVQNARTLDQPRIAFWFFLGLRDRRIRLFKWFRSFGLEDKIPGKTARLEGDRLVGAPTLLDELDALYREWQALGASDIRRFRLRFVPAHRLDQAASPQPTREEVELSGGHVWTVRGPFYRREFFLKTA